MVTQDGNVAIAYYQTIPHVIELGTESFSFVVKANICMAWIPEALSDKILAVTKTCCGGQTKKVYRYANEDDVRRWTNGGGR